MREIKLSDDGLINVDDIVAVDMVAENICKGISGFSPLLPTYKVTMKNNEEVVLSESEMYNVLELRPDLDNYWWGEMLRSIYSDEVKK